MNYSRTEASFHTSTPSSTPTTTTDMKVAGSTTASVGVARGAAGVSASLNVGKSGVTRSTLTRSLAVSPGSDGGISPCQIVSSTSPKSLPVSVCGLPMAGTTVGTVVAAAAAAAAAAATATTGAASATGNTVAGATISAPAVPANTNAQPSKIHYTNEARVVGTGMSKRARCNHCLGDWAYNETRLKHHITDQYRGCRQIPPAVRERVRRADSTSSAQLVVPSVSNPPPQTGTLNPSVAPATHSAPLPSTSPHPNPTATTANTHVPTTHVAASQIPSAAHAHTVGVKRKREVTEIATRPDGPHAPHADPPLVDLPPPTERLPDELAAAMAERPDQPGLRIAIEFSIPSSTLMRAAWIASELIADFRPHVLHVNLIPRSTENTFNLWIDGIIAWSRGVGQPLPDYDHLRPLLRAKCSNSSV